MQIKILGSGCCNCNTLEERTREALAKAGLEAEVVKVTDFAEIMGYGVMSTPGLVVGEELKLAGRVPSVDEIVSILTRAQA